MPDSKIPSLVQDSATIEELVDNDPQYMLRHLARIEMYAKSLKEACQEWADKNGEYVSLDKTVKYQKRTRSMVKLDPDKARSLLKSQGINLADVAEINLTEDGIIAKLGEKEGNKVVSELVSAGAVKVSKTTYWRLQVK
jgi:translation elongation factor EF-Ts